MSTREGQPTWLCYDAVRGGGVQEGRMPLALLSAGFQSLPLLPTIKLGPSGRWACVRSGTLWVSPMNSPVRWGMSPITSTLTGVFSQWLRSFISSNWDPGFRGLSHSPVVPPSLSARECGTAQSEIFCLTGSSSPCLATSPLCPAARLRPSYQSG